MTRINITSLFVLASLFLLLTSMTSAPDSIVGKWLSDDKDFNWEFYKSGNTYSVKVITSKDVLEADGKTFKKDINNPDPELRTRSLQGVTFITGLKFEDDEYTGGKVYSFRDGKTYDCYASVTGDKLSIRMYKGISVLGATFKFNRIK